MHTHNNWSNKTENKQFEIVERIYETARYGTVVHWAASLPLMVRHSRASHTFYRHGATFSHGRKSHRPHIPYVRDVLTIEVTFVQFILPMTSSVENSSNMICHVPTARHGLESQRESESGWNLIRLDADADGNPFWECQTLNIIKKCTCQSRWTD